MKFIDKVNEKEFNQFVSNHPNGHFLKSVEWGKVSKINGWIPFYVGLKSNNKLIATALLLKKSLPFGFSYFYIPRGYTMDYNNFEVLEVFTQEINKFTKTGCRIFITCRFNVIQYFCCFGSTMSIDNFFKNLF